MIKPGQWIEVGEADYLYGSGVLSMQVTWVADSPDPEWVQMKGVSPHWTGERYALVRRSALGERK